MENDSTTLAPWASQSQSQSQQQALTVNIQNSGNPDLELRILNEMYSAGRQLGRLTAVISFLLEDYEQNADTSSNPAVKTAIDDFKAMVADIQKEKLKRTPENFIRQLEQIQKEDSAAFANLREKLQDWLNKT